MVARLLVASSLMALCVVIHALGLSSALRMLRGSTLLRPQFWHSTSLFVMVAVWIVLLHLVEIMMWAVLYVGNGALADLPSAAYFSAVTYTTTGYGDVVLPTEFRLDGAVEALTGILMCGWSTGFFFALVNRIYGQQQPTA
jgi:hypothetical protein